LNYIENTNKIQYLYTYTSGDSTNKFVKSLLDKTQTFEHLFFEKKNEIINDIKNFSNIKYYEKFGMKRKLGYLLVGPPGSGKSALVTAISNELTRSLKNIPISLIKTNSEFEKAYGYFSYDNQSINSSEIVITFDEIDSAYDSQKLIKSLKNNKSNNEDKSDTQSNISAPVIIINPENKNDNESNPTKNFLNLNKDDKLNIGIVLSKLDGNENQDGLVIIATCNDISKLDPALYRNGRLKLIELKYAGRQEITQMIEKYCEIVLNNKQKNKIRNDCTIQSLNIKHLIAKYLLEKNFSICPDDIDKIIDKINDL
jgi:SpoVK/Ycf46/Vps4 family AAA+-type ATPase